MRRTFSATPQLLVQPLLRIFVVLAIIAAIVIPTIPATAAQSDDFSIAVSPSPLVAELTPGYTTQLELKIHNTGSKEEELKIETRSFSLSNDSKDVKLDDKASRISTWVSFGAPTFNVRPNQWYTQTVNIAVPKDAGFSYSFALLISRKNNPQPVEGSRLIKGSVAVFTLLNIDRPGATRKLDLVSFKSTKKIYEYAPATFDISLKNTGNSIVQPYGNIFVQRPGKNKDPISTLAVNESHGYILPDNTRTLSATWDKGFPFVNTTTDANGKTHSETLWDWSKLSDFRIGRYTAKLVAAYNDGHRDVPVEAEVTFWILPWKIMLGGLVILLLMAFGAWTVIRNTTSLFKKAKAHRHHSSTD